MISNRNGKLLWLAAGALIVTMLACGSSPAAQTATDTPTLAATQIPSPTFTPIPLYTVVSMLTNTTDETGASPAYTVKAQVPFLQGSDDLRVTNFNDEMKLLTQEEVAKFKDNAAETVPIAGLSGSTYDQEFKVLSVPGNLISLKFDIMIYIQGSAHPTTHSRTITYDLEAGSDVSLAQLFLPGSDYLERIANYCIAQLKTRNIDFEAFANGADPLPANYGNWNVTPDGLQITFDEYQVAAYAAGSQEVVVPYSELQAVINPDGALSGFLP